MSARIESGALIGRPIDVGGLARAEFRVGDAVRPALSPEDLERTGLVTSVIVGPDGFLYAVAWPGQPDTRHYGWELFAALEEGPFPDPDRAD